MFDEAVLRFKWSRRRWSDFVEERSHLFNELLEGIARDKVVRDAILFSCSRFARRICSISERQSSGKVRGALT